MTGRWAIRAAALALAAMVLSVSGVTLANDGEPGCTVAKLDGLYVFAATGFTIPTPDAALPKAIVEWIHFNGDGTLDVPGATLSLNGVIVQIPAGGTGSYTVADLTPPDGGCAGTLSFTNGPKFDLFIPAKGARTIWLIQTDANNVFQGTATKVSH